MPRIDRASKLTYRNGDGVPISRPPGLIVGGPLLSRPRLQGTGLPRRPVPTRVAGLLTPEPRFVGRCTICALGARQGVSSTIAVSVVFWPPRPSGTAPAPTPVQHHPGPHRPALGGPQGTAVGAVLVSWQQVSVGRHRAGERCDVHVGEEHPAVVDRQRAAPHRQTSQQRTRSQQATPRGRPHQIPTKRDTQNAGVSRIYRHTTVKINRSPTGALP